MTALHGGRTDDLEIVPEPVGRRRPGPRRRGHGPGRQPRRGGRPDRRVPRARHRRVHPVRLPAPGRGLSGRRGRHAGAAVPRPAGQRPGRSSPHGGISVTTRTAPGEPGTAEPGTAEPTVLIRSAAEAIASARDYAASIAGGAIERDRAGAVPVAELAAFDASGLLAITVPREHGGPDLPASVLAEVIRSIAAVDPAIAQVPQAHFLFVDVLVGLRRRGAAGAAVRLGSGRRPSRQRAGRARRPARPGPEDAGPRQRRRRAAPAGPQVLLHRGDHGPLDRRQRPGRRRAPGAGVRRARCAGRLRRR